ncbi:heat shock protein Hsp90 [Pseudohyphozyma bogoriensis]|nr:heat shock protein Hsp90 [Pseudohyphozyma bogoriensis]
MRLLLPLLALSALARAQDSPAANLLSPEDEVKIAGAGETFQYQSDVSRLMSTVVHSLYTDRAVFIRELLSNANDALEKVRLLSLTDSTLLPPAPNLNVSVLADTAGKRIIIRDSGIGMTKEQLTNNLGTIARSGTSEFLDKLDKGSDGANLIGQFGLGFYSSFLVADKVTVASKSNDESTQYIFESNESSHSFSIAEDPRGNTLGRGTEITLWLKDDAKEFLETDALKSLIAKHSEYGASPIYLWTETTVEEPVEAAEAEEEDAEVKVEDEDKKVETRSVTKGAWERVNAVEPLWLRDPKEVSDEEYEEFFKTTFKDTTAPLAWTHFKGDAGPTSFRALIYLPSTMPNDFYSKTYLSLESLKLFVRRVFITSDLGTDYIPKHLNWIKIFVDADDLPLNVGRDALQKSKALSQIQRNLVKRTLDLFASLASKSPEKYNELWTKAGVALKLGAVEDTKNRARIVKLLRFETSASANLTSLDDVVSRRKKGQEQIFYVASAGEKKAQMEKSPFVERLIARGYEVLYFGEPMDEMLASSLSSYEGLKFQDVAKKGLKFDDEEEEAALKETFEPLAKYLKKELEDSINDVVISTRLTTSPCLIVSDSYAWTANMERLMASQNTVGDNFMANFMKSQKRTFEINPKHPLIEALLEKVEEVDGDDFAEAELRETVAVLWQTALVRSGFTVPDPSTYFTQVEALLRRSLGVSLSARADASVKPAPPVEEGPFRPGQPDFDPSTAEEANVPVFEEEPSEWANWADVKKNLKKDEAESVHDEL